MTGEYKDIAQLLYKLRKERRMSQMVLADKSGYTPAYISKVENGIKVPTMTAAEDLFGALGYKIKFVVELEAEK